MTDEKLREYRLIYQDAQATGGWAFQDLDTLDQARELEQSIRDREKKENPKKPPAIIFLRQHVVVTIGGKAAYNTKSEADAAAAKENELRPLSASVSVLFQPDVPYEILYG